MEELQGLQNVREDGSALQRWPFIQHDFFPGQSCKYLPHTTRQIHSVGAANLSVNGGDPQSLWTWEDLSQSDAERSRDPGAMQWKDSWEWDSFSFAARSRPSAIPNDISQTDAHPAVDPKMRSLFPCDLSEQNDLCDESTALELGPKTSSSKDDGFLALKLGGNSSSVAEDGHPQNVKRSRLSPPDNQQPRCQVDNCCADLRNAKDYHRRHKVCESHAKALKASVSWTMQRFCQQCSRFHSLQEFDEDRRSCRRRLAGHNRRRRKTQPDAAAVLAYLLADQNPLTRLINNASGQLEGKDELERLLRLLGGGDVLLQNLLGAKLVGENPENRRSEMGGISNELSDAIARSQIISNLLLSNSSLVHNLPSVAPAESLNTALSKALLLSLQQMQQNRGQTVCMPSSNQQEVPNTEEQSQQLLATVNAIDKNDEHNNFQPDRQDGFSRTSDVECPGSFSFSKFAKPLPVRESVALSSFPDRANHVNAKIVDDMISVDNVELGGLNCCSIQQDKRFVRDVYVQKKKCHIGAVTEQRKALLLDSERLKPVGPSLGEEHAVLDSRITLPEERIETPLLGSDPSSDSGPDMQDRTDRIMFKLLDRGPEELPASLRKQIFEWLDLLPVDMESYIRPGCVILTIFLCMPIVAWEALYGDIEGSLSRLVQSTNGEFWQRGRVFVQVGKASALIIEGRVYSNMNLSSIWTPHLCLVRPFAIVKGENAELIVRGRNLEVPGTKLIFAYGGKYIDKEVELLGEQDRYTERDGDMQDHAMAATPDLQNEQMLAFHVGPFNCIGRGFVEVEGQMLEGNSFPIIVAERSICQEICSLEELESGVSNGCTLDKSGQGKIRAEISHFLHDLGWLFQRNQWKISHGDEVLHKFSSARFSWLLCFAVEHSCCAVVKQILDLMFRTDDESPESVHSRALVTLSEVNLLHIAVRCNSRHMVETLLEYSPPDSVDELLKICVFRPDKPGLANLTPLHIAASMHDADGIVDALTNAPEQFWATAWTSARDSVGQTPLMYALAAGNHISVKMVQSKLQKLHSIEVLVEGTRNDVELNNQLPTPHLAWTSFPTVEERDKRLPVRSSPHRLLLKRRVHHCTCKGENFSSQNLLYRVSGMKGCKYNPFVVSLLAVAALCVCVGLLTRTPPFVAFVRPPFVWDSVKFGSL